jgi:hypothetical protein
MGQTNTAFFTIEYSVRLIYFLNPCCIINVENKMFLWGRIWLRALEY